VVIGGDGGVVFDWEPALLGAAGGPAAPRGHDVRLEDTARRSSQERRERYESVREGRREARSDLAAERAAGRWVSADGEDLDSFDGSDADAGE
jgi:GTP-binding protein